jgi:hypothetical protein
MTIPRNIGFREKIVAEWYQQQTKEKIRKARRSWFQSARRRRGRKP